MRIAITTTTFLSEEKTNGITNTVMLLSRQFVKKGHHVKIFAPKVPKSLPAEEIIDGIEVERIKTKLEFKYAGKFGKDIKDYKPDIVHSFHYAYYPSTAGFSAARSLKVPHILTPSYHKTRMSKTSAFFMNMYNNIYGKSILSKSFRVFPQNINEQTALQKISDFKSTIVPCPINSKFFKPKKVKKSKMTVAYIGTMLPWKGAGIAFDICQKIEQMRDDVKFVFIGPGYLKKELIKKASKRFTFLENMPIKDLSYWCNAADVILYPTFYESFGRVLAEAMACGAPIVSTNVGAVPETVGPGGFIVEYGNWDEMKQKILELLDKKPLRLELGKAAIKHAAQYKDDVVAKNVINIYEEALQCCSKKF